MPSFSPDSHGSPFRRGRPRRRLPGAKPMMVHHGMDANAIRQVSKLDQLIPLSAWYYGGKGGFFRQTQGGSKLNRLKPGLSIRWD